MNNSLEELVLLEIARRAEIFVHKLLSLCFLLVSLALFRELPTYARYSFWSCGFIVWDLIGFLRFSLYLESACYWRHVSLLLLVAYFRKFFANHLSQVFWIANDCPGNYFSVLIFSQFLLNFKLRLVVLFTNYLLLKDASQAALHLKSCVRIWLLPSKDINGHFHALTSLLSLSEICGIRVNLFRWLVVISKSPLIFSCETVPLPATFLWGFRELLLCWS